ncbi:MAG: sugar phosphate isomerase/epimerase [Kiritimatiellae bacterium]|nr:sugar phosphate isomerase/epimerase [Kiritimatiellia bacterium]
MEIGVYAAAIAAEGTRAQMTVLKELGYDFIELPWGKPDVPKLTTEYGRALRELGEETGCPVRTATLTTFADLGTRLRDAGSRQAELETLLGVCRALAAAGGEVLLLPNWAGANDPEYDALYVSYLRDAGNAVADIGVKLAVEHIPGSKYRNRAADIAELADKVDHPHVGVYYDIANNLAAADDPVDAARASAKRVLGYHAKGRARSGLSLADMPLREVREIFEAAGYQGRVALELDKPETAGAEPNAHLAEAIKVMRTAGY